MYVSDTELMHAKYVRKKKVNGKWRYYYDTEKLKNDLGVNARKEYKKAQKEYNSAVEKRRVTTKRLEYRRNHNNTHFNNETTVKKLQEAHWANQSASQNVVRKGQEYTRAASAYYNTPIGKISKATKKAKSYLAKKLKRK